jgi:hypothetical protein
MLDYMVVEHGVERAIGVVHCAGVANKPNVIPLGLQVVHFGIKFHIESFNVSRQCLRQIYHLFARPTTPDDQDAPRVGEVFLDEPLEVPAAFVNHVASPTPAGIIPHPLFGQDSGDV